MCASFFCAKAWTCPRQTTDRDLQSLRNEKVIAWICARPTTHHDSVSVIPDKKKEKEEKRRMQICNCFFCGHIFELFNYVSFSFFFKKK